jgi:hypothetical protein
MPTSSWAMAQRDRLQDGAPGRDLQPGHLREPCVDFLGGRRPQEGMLLGALVVAGKDRDGGNTGGLLVLTEPGRNAQGNGRGDDRHGQDAGDRDELGLSC